MVRVNGLALLLESVDPVSQLVEHLDRSVSLGDGLLLALGVERAGPTGVIHEARHLVLQSSEHAGDLGAIEALGLGSGGLGVGRVCHDVIPSDLGFQWWTWINIIGS